MQRPSSKMHVNRQRQRKLQLQDHISTHYLNVIAVNKISITTSRVFRVLVLLPKHSTFFSTVVVVGGLGIQQQPLKPIHHWTTAFRLISALPYSMQPVRIIRRMSKQHYHPISCHLPTLSRSLAADRQRRGWQLRCASIQSREDAEQPEPANTTAAVHGRLKRGQSLSSTQPCNACVYRPTTDRPIPATASREESSTGDKTTHS